MQDYIYILNDDGRPLMPTKRRQHVNRLLKTHQAHVVSEVPYVVRLDYHSPGITQPLHGGTDPGRTNIGEGVIDDAGNVVYRAVVASRNKDIHGLMMDRKEHRQASRRGERLARKRLAKKHDTLSTKLGEGRLLPGCETPVPVKDIINTEARYNNRKREQGYLTPTVRHLIDTHVNIVKKICSILPVTDWTMEMNKFAFMQMEDGTVRGIDFQNGRMKGYPSVNAYVYAMQEGKCRCCGGKIEHYHHIVPKSKGSSDLPENIAGVCMSCHRKIHKGLITLDLDSVFKKYAGASVLNQAIPYIMKELKEIFGPEHVRECTGMETKELREYMSCKKDHDIDALVIAAKGSGIDKIHMIDHCYDIRQYRRHDRAGIKAQTERSYYLEGKKVCCNRHKRFEQKTDSLEEFREKHSEQDVSRLTVKPSVRRYNDRNRIMPGAIFCFNGERHVLSGTLTNGNYYRAADDTKKKKTNYPASGCLIVRKNTGLVYIS